MATGTGKTGRILKCRLFRRVRKPLTTDGNGNTANGLFRHERKSLRPAEAAATGAVFFQNARKPKPEVAFCYISSLFQSARKPLTRRLEAQTRRRLFRAHAPSVSAGRSDSDGLFQPARKGAVRKGRQVFSGTHGRDGHQLPPSPPRPSIVSACASCMRSASWGAAPPPACRAPSAGRLPSCGPSQSSPTSALLFGLQRIPPAVSRQKQLRRHAEKNAGNPRTPSPCRMARSPHAPYPHGLRSLSVKEKEALFPSSCSRCINFSTFW